MIGWLLLAIWIVGFPIATRIAYRNWTKEFGKSDDLMDEATNIYFCFLCGLMWPIIGAFLLAAMLVRGSRG